MDHHDSRFRIEFLYIDELVELIGAGQTIGALRQTPAVCGGCEAEVKEFHWRLCVAEFFDRYPDSRVSIAFICRACMPAEDRAA
jgi:hypothetical protein